MAATFDSVAEIFIITARNIARNDNVAPEQRTNRYAMLNVPSTAIFLGECVAQLRGANPSANEIANFTAIAMESLLETPQITLQIIKQDVLVNVILFEPATATLPARTHYAYSFVSTDSDGYRMEFDVVRADLEFNPWFSKFDDANEGVEWAHSNIAESSNVDGKTYNDVINAVLQNSGFATGTFFV